MSIQADKNDGLSQEWLEELAAAGKGISGQTTDAMLGMVVRR